MDRRLLVGMGPPSSIASLITLMMRPMVYDSTNNRDNLALSSLNSWGPRELALYKE